MPGDTEKPSFSVDIKSKEPKETGDSETKDEAENPEQETQMSAEKEDTKTPKEKQCWNLYCKMVEKGVNVSFDTVLRGMLTPTEYRMSKKNFPQEEAKEDNNQHTSQAD